ncbi:Protein of uncharacterised function (DUF2752) [Mycobacteroides abscessus subsp. abscessus]|nr:Protein of uncharacterised function (DUF2752) [Mycobacteroides abscessus subsp. abscessus]
MTEREPADGAASDPRPVHPPRERLSARIEHAVLGRVSTVSRHRVAGPAVVVGAAVGCCTAIWFADPTTPGGPLPMCPTKALLHIDCPGCGSLRAIYWLMHGNLGEALRYNAVGVVAIALLGWAFVAYCVGLWRGRRVRSWQHLRFAPIVTLVVVGVWVVIRNIPVAPFDALRV